MAHTQNSTQKGPSVEEATIKSSGETAAGKGPHTFGIDFATRQTLAQANNLTLKKQRTSLTSLITYTKHPLKKSQ